MPREDLHPVSSDLGSRAEALTSSGRPRIAALDVVRGFALCGILLANVQPIAAAARGVVSLEGVGADTSWLGLLVYNRFFPIFSLLFGVGFAMLLNSAASRAGRPRVVLLRRLLVLLGLGLAHFFLLWQGDILTFYAVLGLLVLLPASWLPRWVVAALGPLLVGAALLIGGDRNVLIAGLFLIGSGLVRYGLMDRIETSAKTPTLLGVGFALVAAPAVWLQITAAEMENPRLGTWLALAGLLLAGAYACCLLVLLRTPLRVVLRSVFAPLGRMALTNYLTATLLVLGTSRVVAGPWNTKTVLLIAAGIFGLQWLWSTLWLRWYRFGPLEWLWRWATWGHRPSMRRVVDGRSPVRNSLES